VKTPSRSTLFLHHSLTLKHLDTMQHNMFRHAAHEAAQTGRLPASHSSWRCIAALAPLCASLVLAACAGLGSSKREDLVRQRALERWQALVAGQFAKAYEYSAPGFRSVVTPDAFRSRQGSAVKWEGAEVVSVDCPETARCIAKIRIDFRPLLGGRFGDKIDTHIDETWLLEDGQWWVFQSIKGN